MNELQVIEAALTRASHRRRWHRAWHGLGRGLLAGGALLLLAIAAYKLLPLPGWIVSVAALIAGLRALSGLVVGGWRRASLMEIARWVDDRKQFKERLSTALEVAGSTAPAEWRELLVADAARHAQSFDPREILSFGLPRATRWAALLLA